MRPLTPDELRRLREALHRYQPKDEEHPFGEGGTLWTDGQDPMRVFWVRSFLANALEAAGPSPAPRSIGLFVGELERDRFHLSLEGAQEVGTRCRTGRVVVKDKAASLFLYGRDILGEGVYRIEGVVRRGDVVLIASLRNEILGIARALVSLPANGRILEPLTDRGWYLRAGG